MYTLERTGLVSGLSTLLPQWRSAFPSCPDSRKVVAESASHSSSFPNDAADNLVAQWHGLTWSAVRVVVDHGADANDEAVCAYRHWLYP
ncbi:hypothetical protein PENSPDRAFT_659468 [Peniophora sp. CONT]|nr:hypothetical protein PENSPDRAFT_659468 [Peniophora sp. CONT]